MSERYEPSVIYEFKKLSLPVRMRAAAKVLREATERSHPNKSQRINEWWAQDLLAFADRWEREDAEAAGRERAVEELAQDIADIRPVMGPSMGVAEWRTTLARKLVDAGWMKVTDDLSDPPDTL